MIRVADIQRAIAARHHVSVKAIVGKLRTPKLCRSRHMAMYLARRLTGQSLEAIGRRFGGRHHTTVLNGCRRVQERAFRNQKTQVALASLIDLLTENDVSRGIIRMQGTLDTFAEPTVKKIIIMSWWERKEITDKQARELIRVNKLEAA